MWNCLRITLYNDIIQKQFSIFQRQKNLVRKNVHYKVQLKNIASIKK